MSDLDEIRDRLDALEDEVTRLRDDAEARREDATATRTLAALADRDAGEVRGALRAHTRLLNALRETQSEQGRALVSVSQAVGGLTTEVHELKSDVGALRVDVNDLRETQAAQGRTLDVLKTDVSGLKTDVSALKTDMGGFRTEQIRQGATLERHGDALTELTVMVRRLVERLD